MAPLPYSNTGAQIAFYATVVVFAILEQRTRLRSLLNRQGSRADRGSLVVVVVSVAAGIVGAFLLASEVPGAAIAFARWPVFGLGLVLMWIGIVVRQWSIVLLGRYFTVDVRVQSGQKIVADGPYRWVRHPSYSGMILTLAGMGLALGNWLSLAILLVAPTAGLVFRIVIEERALSAAFGDEYGAFAAGRPRLFPGLW